MKKLKSKIPQKIYDKPVVGCSSKNTSNLKKELNKFLKEEGYSKYGLEWVELGEVKAWFKGGLTDRNHIELWDNGCVTAHYDKGIPHKQDQKRTNILVNEMKLKLTHILKRPSKDSLILRIKRIFNINKN